MAQPIKKVYVVWGQSGEYSDRNEWLVCFFLDEETARRHVEKVSARTREIQEQLRMDDCGTCYASTGPEGYCAQHKAIKNELDPNLRYGDPVNYGLAVVAAGPED